MDGHTFSKSNVLKILKEAAGITPIDLGQEGENVVLYFSCGGLRKTQKIRSHTSPSTPPLSSLLTSVHRRPNSLYQRDQPLDHGPRTNGDHYQHRGRKPEQGFLFQVLWGWSDAHAHCRGQGGFLPSREEYKQLRAAWRLPINLTWTALTPHNGHYQWLSECPASSDFVTWREGKQPELWSRDCAALSVHLQEFQLHACAHQLPFFCVLHNISHLGDVEAADDMELRVEASTATGSHGWIPVTTSQFHDLTLSCHAYSKTTGELLSRQPRVFWRKDLVYMNHCVKNMMPATLHDPTKSTADTVLPGVTEKPPIFINQGTYWCETWMPNGTARLTSNKVLVTLEEWLVFVFHAHRNESFPGGTEDQAKDLLRKSFVKQFYKISNYTLDVISIEKEVVRTAYLRTNYSFHLHVPRADFIRQELSFLKHKIQTYKEIYKSNGYLPSSKIAFPTLCLGGKNSFGSEHNLTWPFTLAGDVHPENYKCKVKYDKLYPGRCAWDYIHGARLVFDPSQCEWQDLCPHGYTRVLDSCVTISAPGSWMSGFITTFNTSQERSVLDSSWFFIKRGGSTLYDEIKNMVTSRRNHTKIWLPVKRLRRLSPLIYMGPRQPEHSYEQYKSFNEHGISWAKQHPRSDEECLALNMVTNSLQTADCNTHLPFVTIVNGTFLKKSQSSWESLIKNCSLCPATWSTTTLKSDNEIYFKLFMNQGNLTWPEASSFCEKERAQLPSPNVGFLDWVYRQHLYFHKVSDVWMGVKWIHERLLYNGSVDNINWLAETNYTKNYGTLTQTGWILEDEEITKQNILCQQIMSPKKSMHLQVHKPANEVSQTMCIDVDPESLLIDRDDRYLQCYVNGKYTKHEQTEDSGCQYELKVNSQGFYQCLAWAQPPLTLAYSNVILHRDHRTYTFVVTLSQDTGYEPEYHDSTFRKKQKRQSSPETCTDVFMASLKNIRLANQLRFNSRNLFYLPDPNDGKLLHNFHLECELKETDSNLLEKQLFETLIEMLPNGKQFSNCTLMGIRSTVGCSADTTHNYGFNSTRNLTWPATQGNSVVIPKELCITYEGEPVTRECLGNFYEGYYWSVAGNCTGEPSQVTQRLWEINSDPKRYLEFPSNSSTSLAELTTDSLQLQPVDIHFIAKTLESFSKVESPRWLSLDEIVETINNVMGANSSVFEPVQMKLNSSSTLLEAFEQLTFQVELPSKKGDQMKNSSRKLISVERLDLEVNSTIVGYKSREQGEGDGRVETLVKGVVQSDLLDAEAAIILPSNLTYTVASKTAREATNRVREDKKVSMTFAVYRNEKLFQDNISLVNYTVNSRIIQASFKGEAVRNLEYPIKIYFKPHLPGNDTKCVFWDFKKNEGRGGWSEEGCRQGGRVGDHHICLCTHLTCFAQLINYDKNSNFNDTHELILDAITIIGCCLSIIGLLLVFTTFFLFKKWRRSLSNKILVHLSFSVFCSVVIFLAGINQTWNDILCRGVAVGLHYFLLTSFAWMLVEAVHQYLKFVKVVGTYIPRFLWKASVCAWGIPLLPILVVLVYDPSLYDSKEEYTNGKICWMSVDGFKYAFLPPLVATMTANLIIFSMIIHGAVCGRARVTSTMPERTLFMNQFRMAVSVFFLLGFTWIFGLLAVSHARTVFSYLFCIFNTLQGFFLFVFHVFRERSARKYWKDFLSVLTQDPVSSTPGNSMNLPHSGHFCDHRDSVTFEKYGGILVLPQGLVRPHLRRTVRGSLLSARTASTLVHSRASFSP
ncbi:uncharacterized protein [Procambarus clarkii]|uniref:uncharacterized protein isoform X2 n=1 Tax=Procambarus clarkii TaxID=6728 RepID=UPI001E6751AC|nr:uncharacterized protein LOC123746817 isoform X2 [Procambarus clarkii]